MNIMREYARGWQQSALKEAIGVLLLLALKYHLADWPSSTREIYFASHAIPVFLFPVYNVVQVPV